MLEFRQFVVALNGKSYRDTKHIDNGFSPPTAWINSRALKDVDSLRVFFSMVNIISSSRKCYKKRNIQPANLLSLTTI